MLRAQGDEGGRTKSREGTREIKLFATYITRHSFSYASLSFLKKCSLSLRTIPTMNITGQIYVAI